MEYRSWEKEDELNDDDNEGGLKQLDIKIQSINNNMFSSLERNQNAQRQE